MLGKGWRGKERGWIHYNQETGKTIILAAATFFEPSLRGMCYFMGMLS